MTASSKIRTLLLAFVLTGTAGNAWAQEPQEQPPTQESEPGQTVPKPAARGIPAFNDSSDLNTDQGNTDVWQPDPSPVTGLEAPTLGSPPMRHSYWVPGLQYGITAQSGPLGEKNSSWYETHFMGGSLSLLKAWSHSTLALNESVGGVVTSQSAPQYSEGNSWYQQLGVTQSFQSRRWLWQWSDQFAYLPETQFGFGAGTGLALPGVGGSLGPSLTSGLPPSQSIASAAGSRYSNTAVIQTTYTLDARQSITIAGMDGTLHFTQAPNVNSENYLGSVGYNYTLTKEDSIGLMYRFSTFHFPAQSEAYGDSSFSVAYQRKMTRKLALQLYAGPDFISYRVPLGGSTKRTSAQADASLSYGFRRGSISVNYSHGLSAGSGVLIGGELDQVTFTGTRQISRLWSVTGNFGYASNRALNNAAGVGFGSYDNYFVGGGLARPIGRVMNFAVSYNAYIQRAGPQGCTVANCNANSTQHTITAFLNWRARPFVIE